METPTQSSKAPHAHRFQGLHPRGANNVTLPLHRPFVMLPRRIQRHDGPGKFARVGATRPVRSPTHRRTTQRRRPRSKLPRCFQLQHGGRGGFPRPRRRPGYLLDAFPGGAVRLVGSLGFCRGHVAHRGRPGRFHAAVGGDRYPGRRPGQAARAVHLGLFERPRPPRLLVRLGRSLDEIVLMA